VAYVARAKQLAMREISSDPKHFLFATLCRIYYFWYDTPRFDPKLGVLSPVRNLLFAFSSVVGFLGAGLMWRQRVRGAPLFVLLFITVPFVYYLTFPHPRYRAPIEPMIVILGVYLFQSAQRKSRNESCTGGKAEIFNAQPAASTPGLNHPARL
jgi:energy-coupling factor transporter transmembrane protein EcfT